MNIWNIFNSKTVRPELTEIPAKINSVLEQTDQHTTLIPEERNELAKELQDPRFTTSYLTLIQLRNEILEDPTLIEQLPAAAAQAEEAVGEKGKATISRLISRLCFCFPAILRLLEAKMQDEPDVEIDFIPAKGAETYYYNKGFRPLEGAPHLWVKIEKTLESENLETSQEAPTLPSMLISEPQSRREVDQADETISITREHHESDLDEKLLSKQSKMVQISVANLDGEEYVLKFDHGAISRTDLECKLMYFLNNATSQEPIDLPDNVSHKKELREELKDLASQAESFFKKHENVLGTEDKFNEVLTPIVKSIENETNFDTLVHMRDFLGLTFAAAMQVRANMSDGFPVTAENDEVKDAVEALLDLQDALGGERDDLIALSTELSREMVMKDLLHPNAKKAFDAGMKFADVIEFSDSLSKTDSVVGPLFEQIKKMKGNPENSREVQTRDLNRLIELQNKVTEGTEISEDDSNFFDAVTQLVTDTVKLSEIENYDLETAIAELVKINPLSTHFQNTVRNTAAGNKEFKNAFIKLAEGLIEAHHQIHESLLDTGKLPSNYFEIDKKVMQLLVDNSGLIQSMAEDAEFGSEFWQGMTNLVVHRNQQIFSDIEALGGFSVDFADLEKLKKDQNKLGRFFRNIVNYKDQERGIKTLGCYSKQMFYVGEKSLLLGKADWNPEITKQDKEGRNYFKKGSVTIGKALVDLRVDKTQKRQNWNIDKWGPIREVKVELDLEELTFLDDREKTDIYFSLCEWIGKGKNEIKDKFYNNDEFPQDKRNKIGTENAEALIDHFFSFSQKVNRALYLTQYAILHPEESYEEFGVKTRSISEIET